MWHFLFGWRGRVSRSPFCLFALIAFVLFLALMSALYFYEVSAGNYENGGPTPWPSSPVGILGAAAWFLALFLIFASALAVSAKRLHDRDKSAWWLIIFVAAPNAFTSFAQYWQDAHPGEADVPALASRLVSLALFAWAFVELACLRGTQGQNRFGDDPLKRSS